MPGAITDCCCLCLLLCLLCSACPIVDSVEGVTHALRTNEYRDRNEQYRWLCSALSIRCPLIRDYARLNFVYTTLSKRKLTWFVDTGRVQGWDDPRMPTIRGMLRRGLTVEALREFIGLQGFSSATTLMEWDKIWTINKRIIDPVARRFTAVSRERTVTLRVSGVVHEAGQREVMTVDAHPKQPELGVKALVKSDTLLIEQADAVSFREGEEITLLNLGNAVIDSIETDAASSTVVSVSAHLNPAGDVKATDKKVTWVDGHALSLADGVELRLVELDSLISVAKVEDGVDMAEIVREQSWYETLCVGEMGLRSVQKGEIIQLQRRGHCRCDEPAGQDGKQMLLFLIPDGRTKSVSVLGSKVDKGKAAGGKDRQH